MRVEIYDRLLAMQAGRRKFLQGAVALAGSTALSTSLIGRVMAAEMTDDEKALRAQILQIPGVGKGSPDRCRLAEGRRALPRRRPRPTSPRASSRASS